MIVFEFGSMEVGLGCSAQWASVCDDNVTLRHLFSYFSFLDFHKRASTVELLHRKSRPEHQSSQRFWQR